MGGHAAFIWPAYGIAALVMLGLIVLSARRLASLRRELERLRGNPPEDPS
ncbi:MAG: heme exporter protein CcmD [Dongiaceae bacterium]